MGILDDAIKEHLELKRQHGAGESELKQLEDEAFGAPGRPGDEAAPAPDPLAEAPTEFLTQPGQEGSEEEPEAALEGGDGEAPPAPKAEGSRRPPRAEIASLQEGPEPVAEPESAADAEAPEPPEPADEPSPAMEHAAIPEPAAPELEPAAPEPDPAAAEDPDPAPEQPAPSAVHDTTEREQISEQPTQIHDVEEELDAAPAEQADALEDDEDFDDFWDEKRLSDELDAALDGPLDDEEDDELAEEEADAEAPDEPQQRAPAEEEEPQPRRREEDVLEETPDFLEEAPEDDQLWFEQKPPKDFDFDD